MTSIFLFYEPLIQNFYEPCSFNFLNVYLLGFWSFYFLGLLRLLLRSRNFGFYANFKIKLCCFTIFFKNFFNDRKSTRKNILLYEKEELMWKWKIHSMNWQFFYIFFFHFYTIFGKKNTFINDQYSLINLIALDSSYEVAYFIYLQTNCFLSLVLISLLTIWNVHIDYIKH